MRQGKKRCYFYYSSDKHTLHCNSGNHGRGNQVETKTLAVTPVVWTGLANRWIFLWKSLLGLIFIFITTQQGLYVSRHLPCLQYDKEIVQLLYCNVGTIMSPSLKLTDFLLRFCFFYLSGENLLFSCVRVASRAYNLYFDFFFSSETAICPECVFKQKNV